MTLQKIFLSLYLLCFVAGLGTATAVAQTNSDPAVTQNTAALSSQTQNRMRNLAANLSNRFDATISRLQQISNRIESRQQKQQAAGYDTTVTQEKLEIAFASLERSQNNMSYIDEQVEKTITSSDPSAAWPTLRNVYEQTAAELALSHRALFEALTQLQINLSTTTSTEE